MIAYNIITAICFSLLTLSALYVIASCIFKNRAERVDFLRGFKKGKCIAIFLIAIPLLSIGYVYAGSSVIDGILNSLGHVVDFVVLKFGISKVGALVDANIYYKITTYYCCILVILNAMLFALSIIGQQIWQFFNMLVRRFTRKSGMIIFGCNDNSISIYNSNRTFCAVVVDKISGEVGLELYKNRIGYISQDEHSEYIGKIIKRVLKGRKYTIVINKQNDENNLSICNFFIDNIRKLTETQKLQIFNNLSIYVLGDPISEALYLDIESRSFGCVHYKNKYQMLAMDFVDKYPFAKFMDEKHIDYSTSLIKPDIDINVCMIGFGKPNRQIFLTSVANNQFLTATENGVELKQVKYHIFDKNAAENNKNFNHLYYRFRNECKNIDPADYLPLPAFPAAEEFHHLDINASEFYEEMRRVITRRPTDVNFAVVSFDSDLENLDMAQKLVEKRREWNVENLVIFVRTKKSHKEHFIFSEKNVFFIGMEDECVYNIDRIINDKFSKMAQMRNEIYDLEYAITTEKGFVLNEAAVLQNRIKSNKKWFLSKSRLERESSLYGCLSLRSKLNLMGLEYCKIDDNGLPAMTEDEYMNYYAGEDLPDTQTYGLIVDGKKVINYTLDFRQSRRYNLAVLEHLRWNSFMISKGIIPATKEQIMSELAEGDDQKRYTNGKNYRLRRHGNLTTFAGLVEFRQMVAKRDCKNETDCDVIKYDYQILDDAYWLLSKNGYKIVKKK